MDEVALTNLCAIRLIELKHREAKKSGVFTAEFAEDAEEERV